MTSAETDIMPKITVDTAPTTNDSVTAPSLSETTVSTTETEPITAPVTTTVQKTTIERQTAPAFDPDNEAKDFSWPLKAGVLTISGHSRKPDYEFEEALWFDVIEDIETVVISDGISNIGNLSF